MAFSMKLNMKEVEDWVKNQPERDRAKKTSLIVLSNELIAEVYKEINKHNTIGHLSQSVSKVVTSNKIEIKTLGHGDIVLEYGRKPGTYPPTAPLRDWVTKKFGVSYQESYPIARQIAKNIHDRGTQKYHSGTDRAGTGRQITEIEKRLNEDLMPRRIEYLLNAYTK